MSDDEFSDPEFDNGGRKHDDEFDDSGFDDSVDQPRVQSRMVKNQPFDEAVELTSDGSLDDSVDTALMASTGGRRHGGHPTPARGDSPPNPTEESADNPGYDSDVEIPGGGLPSQARPSARPAAPAPAPAAAQVTGSMNDGAASDSSSDDEEEGDEANDSMAGTVGGYNPADYANLAVPDDVRELFQYIGRYKPHNIALDTRIKCFIPDYIPAVGEIDAFIKVERPDGKEEELGLKRLDEPAPNQSDPTVLDLQLRAVSKKSNLEPMMVRSIEHADKNPKQVQKWIQSVQDLHRTKPLPQVHYAKAMPDIDSLMQVWPEEFEEVLKTTTLPSASMDLDLAEYVRVICAILDIPVYASLAQSLHVLFTLYSEFKSNQHFQQLGGGAPMPTGLGGAPGAGAGAGDVMVFDNGDSESKM